MESIVDIFDCLHTSIGEETYKDKSKINLVEYGIFFHYHLYFIPTNKKGYGKVEKLPPPDSSSFDWPLPCQSTSEAYQCKFFTKI